MDGHFLRTGRPFLGHPQTRRRHVRALVTKDPSAVYGALHIRALCAWSLRSLSEFSEFKPPSQAGAHQKSAEITK